MKIYENDSYAARIETTVTDCIRKDDRILIRLADTIFFPEEGGQYADRGLLLWGEHREAQETAGPTATEISGRTGQAKTAGDPRNLRGCFPGEHSVWTPALVNVWAEAEAWEHATALTDGHIVKGEILYDVEEEIPAGTPVIGLLDRELRFHRMQQHSGEHVLTGLIHNTYGYDNVGFHLSDDSPVTLDLNGELTAEQLQEMEDLANEAVYANLPIRASYPTREELKNLEYRSKIEIEGQVRIITVGEAENPLDVCACCAPHVARTGEIGMIRIIYSQRYKGGIRIGILCGRRALDHYRQEWQRMNRIARLYSTGTDKVEESVRNQKEENAALKAQAETQAEEILMTKINALPAGRNAVLCVPQLSAAGMKNGFNAMAARFPGFVGLFVGNDADGYRFHAGSIAEDSRTLAAAMRQKLGSKGGGNADMIQGKVNAAEQQLREFFGGL